ncbi:MAG: hypothetical protein ACI9GE_000329 [Oceanospirillaceae bacterium]|jgi:uncharacterized protein YbgA (DUF1722 family)/uncharacterized protein YbbK (DUF523 family)
MNNQHIIDSNKAASDIDQPTIPVGISACLAGDKVRYNGGHTQSRLCLDLLSQCFKFTTFCPEVEAGFGTPRPTMRLIGNPASPQLVFSNDSTSNLTEQLVKGFEKKLPEMSHLDGYILMKNSPSCGLERIKVYLPNGNPHQIRTAGVFAKALKQQYPLMPIEEEGRLHDDKLFDNFVLRVYAHSNFRKEVLEQPSLHNLIIFHSRYKYLLMAHNQDKYRALGRLLGGNTSVPLATLINTYFCDFMEVLSKPSSRKNHTNALFHILGYLKGNLTSVAREHIIEVIHNYNKGITPLTTPLTLLKHHLMQHGSTYIQHQRYFEPYPEKISPVI